MALCLALPLMFSFTPAPALHIKPAAAYKKIIASKTSAGKSSLKERLFSFYNASLKRAGLSKDAFKYAVTGYMNLLSKGMVNNSRYLTIIDFSQSSLKKRFYLLDVQAAKLLINTYVAHGRKSGSIMANNFSNRPESSESSLGFYITKHTYYGNHGLSLRIGGVEKGFNTNAEERAIVVHGSHYVNGSMARAGFMGRSLGCPALPSAVSGQVIQKIKNGSALFIFHPTKSYLQNSKLLAKA
ncbi:MAG: murein L,D-transpeptidase catalytic domain family protein [Chitinophagaceae bacterium]|nr:murein L,D-transpeptidase catalytic domain family protein [Chitinophagaceae bacterium]